MEISRGLSALAGIKQYVQVMGQKVIVHVFSPEDIQTVYRWKHSVCTRTNLNINVLVFKVRVKL